MRSISFCDMLIGAACRCYLVWSMLADDQGYPSTGGGRAMTWTWDTTLLLIQVLIVIGYAIPVIMLFIIPTNRKPSSATAWLLTMLLLPYLRLLIYFLPASPTLPAPPPSPPSYPSTLTPHPSA